MRAARPPNVPTQPYGCRVSRLMVPPPAGRGGAEARRVTSRRVFDDLRLFAALTSAKEECAAQLERAPDEVEGRVDDQLAHKGGDDAAHHRGGDARMTSEPMPVAHRMGTRAMKVVVTVIILGRIRCTAPSWTAAARSR